MSQSQLYVAPGDQDWAGSRREASFPTYTAMLVLGAVLLVLVLKQDQLPQTAASPPSEASLRTKSVSTILSTTLGTSTLATTTVLETTQKTTSTAPEIDYDCSSYLDLGEIAKPWQKGIAVDDTTFSGCTQKIPQRWPNSGSQLSSLRLFKAWDERWGDERRSKTWKELKNLVHRRKMSVLVGTQVTCNETADDREWEMVLQLIQLLGREHVMGIAVGNEMELIHFQRDKISATCVERIWEGGYYRRKFLERGANLAFLPGFQDVPLTSVFGGYIMHGFPFVDEPHARVLPFVKSMIEVLGERYAFSLNIYPYFDPQNVLDSGSTACTESLQRALCMEKGCTLPQNIAEMHRRISKVQNKSYKLWITETGWSFPMADSLLGANPAMAKCHGFSSQKAFRRYYENFLKWDLTLEGSRGPDHMFFFTLRDASNLGTGEHFGLIEDCSSSSCKLKDGTGENPLGLLNHGDVSAI